MMTTAEFINACGTDGQKIERLIRNFYRALPDRRVFIDGGAHGGYHTFFASKYFNGRVIGVEASPKIYVNLIKNRKQAEVSPQECDAFVLNAALGVRSEQGDTVNFFYSPTHPGRSTVNTKMWDAWGKGSVVYEAPILAPIIEIDDIAALYSGGGNVDFIKLDLEGNEIKALRGGSATLQKHRPAAVIEFGLKPTNENLYSETLSDFVSMIKGWGYRAFSPWGEDVTDTLVAGYSFWYLFLLPEGEKLTSMTNLLESCYATAVAE